MVPDESHPNHGDKYCKNGWWMPSQKGWFSGNSMSTHIQ